MRPKHLDRPPVTGCRTGHKLRPLHVSRGYKIKYSKHMANTLNLFSSHLCIFKCELFLVTFVLSGYLACLVQRMYWRELTAVPFRNLYILIFLQYGFILYCQPMLLYCYSHSVIGEVLYFRMGYKLLHKSFTVDEVRIYSPNYSLFC